MFVASVLIMCSVIMAQQDESCTTHKQSNMHTTYSETSMNPSLMCHFPESTIHFIITSDMLFPCLFHT